MMTDKADNREEKILSAYYDYIGEQYVDILCKEMDDRKEEINRVKVPESLDQWFAQYISQYKRKEAAQLFFGKLKTAGTKIAAILFLLIASMFIVTISVDAIRLKVYNLLLESNEKYSSVRVDEVPEGLADWKSYYLPAWLPEGFRVRNAKDFSNVKMIEFTNEDGLKIVFTQAINGSELQLNTEGGKQTEVLIHHQQAILSEKPGETILFWNNEESSFCLVSGLNSEVLIQIAESVKQK